MVRTQGRNMRALALGVTTVMLLAACQGTQASPTPGASSTPVATTTGATPTGTPVVTNPPEPTATPENRSGGTLFILAPTDLSNAGEGIQDLDPQRTYTGEDLALLGAYINRTLNGYVYSDDPAAASALVADAATDTGTASADAKTWSFTVRDGIKWQDGSAVTCEDFKFGASRVFAVDLVGGGPAYALAYLDIPSVDGFAPVTDDAGNVTGYEASSALAYAGPYQENIPGLFADDQGTQPIANDQAAFDAAVECDGQTITYHLKAPIADFNYTVTLGLGAVPNPVDHPDVPLSFSGSEAYNDTPWSNGPYMIESFERGVGGHLHFVRNPNYDPATDESGRMAYPDEIMMEQGLDPAVLDTRMITPTGDDRFAVSQGNVEPQNLDTVYADPHTANPDFVGRAFSDFDPYVSYYTIRTDVVTNPKIRQAMAVALNRDALRQNGGGEYVGDYADGFIKPNIGMDYAPTGLWDATGPFGQVIPGTGDPALAQQLIADSGEAAPTLTWQYVPSDVSNRAAGIIQDSLQQAGFTINLSEITGPRYACYFDLDCQTEFQGTGWGPDWPNASTVIAPLFTTDGGWDISRVGQVNGVNDPSSPDADYVDAVHANLGQTDRQAQATEWQRLNALAGERMYAIPTFFGLTQTMAGDAVGNLYRWGPYGSWPYGILYLKNQ
jgi:peptide/nickel transport system substrate-binding protein